MIRILLSVFLVLHGLVHLLYLGQSARYFELQSGMLWPDGSLVLSGFLGKDGIRVLACALLLLAAAGFVFGGIGLLLMQPWWRTMVAGTAAFSSLIYLLFWDGSLQDLDNKGAIGLLINIAILAAVLLFQWPTLD